MTDTLPTLPFNLATALAAEDHTLVMARVFDALNIEHSLSRTVEELESCGEVVELNSWYANQTVRL